MRHLHRHWPPFCGQQSSLALTAPLRASRVVAPPRVFHVLWWIPHYRAAVFRRLSENPQLEFTVIAGDNAATKDGAVIASASQAGLQHGIRWRKVRSKRIQGLWGYEWQPEAIRIVWNETPDAVIVLGSKSLSNFVIRAICRMRRIPLVEWTIGTRKPERGLKWWLRWSLYAAWPNAHLLYGTAAKDWYIAHGMDPARLFVVRNSLDYERQVAVRSTVTPARIQEIRRTYGITGLKGRLLVYSGRLEREKRIAILFAALRILQPQAPDLRLVLVGGGRARAELEHQAKSAGINAATHFAGECYDERRLGEIFMASDLCASPGPVGLVAMHSLAYGTPVLACENTSWIHGPEIEAIVEGKTGAFHRENDPNDLARKLSQLLYPEPCKPRMQADCIRTVAQFYTPEYQEQVVLRALNSLLPKRLQSSEKNALGQEACRTHGCE